MEHIIIKQKLDNHNEKRKIEVNTKKGWRKTSFMKQNTIDIGIRSYKKLKRTISNLEKSKESHQWTNPPRVEEKMIIIYSISI